MKFTSHRSAALLALATLPFALGGTARAAVSIAGTITDDAGTQLSRWATTSVVKTLDPDGDNRYGTWAGEHVGVENHNAPHIGFISIGAGNQVVGPFGGYDSVDNGAGGSATMLTTTGNDLSNVITYSIPDASTIPFGVRVGWIVDGLDGPIFTGISYTMEHFRGVTSLGSATIGLTPNGTGTAGVTTMDGLFFNLTGVQNGDTIRLSTTYPTPAPGGVYATFQGVSFDALPAPEPSALLLGGLTALGLAVRRRR
ncbi:MAG TPA: PEP-CTERM sorting domain-containing protein [Verrucomicrobiales bacterium]|jgi:hypothetical protein|nr:PEP-CTERM sorting domain-containing protein [Verrucomicrobiales bacterium]